MILTPYAALEPELCLDISASSVILHYFIVTVVCSMLFPSPYIAGTGHLSAVLCLLCVYGLVIHKDTILRAITRAWGSNDMYSRDLLAAERALSGQT